MSFVMTINLVAFARDQRIPLGEVQAARDHFRNQVGEVYLGGPGPAESTRTPTQNQSRAFEHRHHDIDSLMILGADDEMRIFAWDRTLGRQRTPSKKFHTAMPNYGKKCNCRSDEKIRRGSWF
jgi:hypothetical protein